MKFIKYIVIIAVALSTFTSCRKGPEDPLLSLTTRKNRISKVWEAYSYRVNGVELLEEDKIESRNIADCGTQSIHTLTNRDIIMEFTKDGGFREVFTTTDQITAKTSVSSEACEEFNYSIVEKDEDADIGKWNFAGGTGNTLRREQVFIYKEETKKGHVWDIVRLAKEELKIKRTYIKNGESTFTVEEIFFYPMK